MDQKMPYQTLNPEVDEHHQLFLQYGSAIIRFESKQPLIITATP